MKRVNKYEDPYNTKRSNNENIPSGSAQYQMGRNNESSQYFNMTKRTVDLMPIPRQGTKQQTWIQNNSNQRVTNAYMPKAGSLISPNQNVANTNTTQMTANPALSQSMDQSYLPNRPGTSKPTQQHTIVELTDDTDMENAFEKRMRELSKQKFLTGSVGKIIKWHNLLNGLFCLYEVIGPLHSLREGTLPLQKVLLMRDTQGPVLKVIHYSSDRIDLDNFHLGQIIRCVGRIINDNTLQSVCIREATPGEISALSRLTYLSDLAVKTYVQNKV